MKRALVRKAVLIAFVIALFVIALPAVAQEGTTTTTAPASSTTAAPAEQLNPAIPADTTVPPPSTPDWTYRYLIPTGLVIAGLVVVITSIRYFTNVVRKRYRIIEE
ncbi:MAG TPA: hypothetical protein VF246_09950 [Acidimicrobiia bacterium]|jgi:hypothetical protein